MPGLYDRLGVVDVSLFLLAIITQALGTLPLDILIVNALLFVVYLPLLPLDVLRHSFDLGQSLLQVLAVRIVAFAFRYVDPRLGRIVFGAQAALPLARRRIADFDERCTRIDEEGISGYWIGEKTAPFALLYVHGGGFVMGDAAFYLPFLNALAMEASCGVVICDYPLAPESDFANMLEAMIRSWAWLARRCDRIGIAGDSAGAALALSLRVGIARGQYALPPPLLSILISPIVNLDMPTFVSDRSSLRRNDKFDFVAAESLRYYCSLALGLRPERPHAVTRFLYDRFGIRSYGRRRAEPSRKAADDRFLSPGSHLDLLARAPGKTLVVYGTGEVLADEAQSLVALGWSALTARAVHAWPIVLFNLGRDADERRAGTLAIARWIQAQDL